MKTAIIIVGHIRTWLECRDNFMEAFGHLNPDVFVSTYDLQYNYHPAQRGWMGGTTDTYLTLNEIQSYFIGINTIDVEMESMNDVTAEYASIKNKLHINFQNEVHTYLQYRKINRCVDMILNHENKVGIEYDTIIKIRSDIHHNVFECVLDNKTAIVSSGNVFPNDVIIAATRENFVKMTEFFKDEFYNPIYDDSHLQAPHNLLLRSITHTGIDVVTYDLMKYVVRKTGKHHYN